MGKIKKSQAGRKHVVSVKGKVGKRTSTVKAHYSK